MIKVKHSGNFDRIEKFFKGNVTSEYIRILERYGREGVMALASATPVDTGQTAGSWDYELRVFDGGAAIGWVNSNKVGGVLIALILQYGHGTRNGGYVQGRDYINPAIQPIFDKIGNEVWKEVTAL